jgi:GntR family transcriptional regulator/MocR family aminotransferase
MVVADGHRLAPDFRMAFVTPSRQQPLGVAMSLARRFQLLAAAESANAWIIEYDSDGEFHYSGQPFPAIRSADRAGRVLYVGSFSKSLFPSLRLGYLVVPESLVDVFTEIFNAYLPGTSLGVQATVAAFMEEGHFAMHLRRMCRIYQERRDVLVDAARHRFGELLMVHETESGLDTVGHLHPDLAEKEVAQLANDHGITVVPFSRYCLEPIPYNGLVLGFSGFSPARIDAGTKALEQLLCTMVSGSRL